MLQDSGLLREVLPELSETVTCEQSPEYHPEGTVFNHLVRMLEQLPLDAPSSLAWAVLLHDIAKPRTFERDPATGAIHFYGHERVGAEMAENILRRLKFPRKQIEEVVQCVRCHMQFKDVPQMRKATVRRLILRPTFPLELQLHRLDCLGSHGSLDIYERLVAEAQELQRQPTIIPPLLTGSDLIALGMPPGAGYGRVARSSSANCSCRKSSQRQTSARLGGKTAPVQQPEGRKIGVRIRSRSYRIMGGRLRAPMEALRSHIKPWLCQNDSVRPP